MNQTKRTIAFAVVAGCSLAVAAATNHWTKPSQVAGFEKVGEEFYPEFSDPSAAASIRVAAYDEATASNNVFNVEFKDGQWRIPSHHYYPADAKDQLAKTAASVIGIRRGALVSRRATDHERFGVVDPLDDDATALKGRGKRLSLLDEQGNSLVDLIIGNKAEDGNNEYYVRRFDEKATYLATVDVSLSTKFSDWVEQDLLKLERDRLTSLEIHRPHVDDQQRITGEDVLAVSREKSQDPWKVTGLDEAKETVQTGEVNKLVSALDELKLAGVRPKPRGADGEPMLTSDLTFRPPAEFANNRQLLQEIMRGLQGDLARKGFFISGDDAENARLYSAEGELVATTDEGVRYTLHFGGLFTGDAEDIEIGNDAEADNEASAEKDKSDSAQVDEPASDSADDQPDDAGKDSDADTDESKAGMTKNRYLYVRVDFEESLVSGKPTAPTAPEKPAILDEQPAEEKAGETPNAAETDASDSEAQPPDEADPKDEANAEDAAKAADGEASETKTDEKKPDPKEEAQAAYDAAMKKFEADLAQYERDLKAYESKVKSGREKVEDLNERFGEWYYVISDASYQKLRPTRESLVQPKVEEAESAAEGSTPAAVTPGTESTTPAEPVAPAENEAQTPANDPAAEPTKPADAKPAVEAPADPKPAKDAKESAEPLKSEPNAPQAETSPAPQAKDAEPGSPPKSDETGEPQPPAESNEGKTES